MSPEPLLSQALGEASSNTLQHPWRVLENISQLYSRSIAVNRATESQQSRDDISVSGLTSISYGDLHRSAEAFAASLTERGIAPHSRIIVALRNGVEWATIMWTAARLSCTLVPLSVDASRDVATFKHIMQLTSPHAVIVENTEMAATVDECLLQQTSPQPPAVKVVAGFHVPDTWIPYSDLLQSQAPSSLENCSVTEDINYTPLILFTSGSTGRPKGCPYTLRTLLNPAADIIAKTKVTEASIACNLMPNNHIVGFWWWYCFMAQGGQVVCSDTARFSVNDIVRMSELYKCTHLVCVSSVIPSLAKEIARDGKSLDLECILLAGESVSKGHLRSCIETVKCKHVGILYGMTEGVPFGVEIASDWRDLVRAGEVISGSVAKGAAIRICDPVTQSIVPRGQLGELYQSGEQLIPYYLLEGKELVWLPTGDQARMDHDGRVSITGRYKDIINKAGEKYSPIVIEEIIGSICNGAETVVVPVADEIGGEAIVAVINIDDALPVTAIRAAILAKLPPACVPDHFVPLQALQLSDFPRTGSKKISKQALIATVSHYVSKNSAGQTIDGRVNVKSKVLEIWSRLLSCPLDDVDVSKSVQMFADSMLLTKYANRVEKRLGVAVPLNVLATLNTIQDQIEYIETRMNHKEVGQSFRRANVDTKGGPPTAGSMSFTMGDEGLASKTKTLVDTMLSPYGFSWMQDVVDVIPAYDTVGTLMSPNRLLSYSFRWVLLTQDHSVDGLQQALKATLRNNNMLTAFFTREYRDAFHCDRQQPLHVLLKPSEKLLASCIRSDPDSVVSVTDLATHLWHDEELDHAGFPGPLFKANVVKVRETGSAAVIFNANHVNFDGTTVQLFFEDLDQSLSKPEEALEPHFPYKVWADTFWQLRDSLEAQKSVAWHVRRLSSLWEHKAGLFPPQIAPEWFTGSSAGWQPGPEAVAKSYVNPTRTALQQEDPLKGTLGYRWHSSMDALPGFRQRNPDIRNDIVFKAALVLLNVQQTGHHTAMFSSTQGCRDKMPFVPNTLEPYLGLSGQIADINGPLFGWPANIISVKDQRETTLEFLQRVQADQDSLAVHSYAPVADIIEQLDRESGLMIPDIIRRQLFNYIPAMVVDSDDETSSPYRSFKIVQEAARSDLGLHWRCWTGGQDSTECHLWLCWDEANCTKTQIMTWADKFGKILAWLIEEAHERLPVLSFQGHLN